MSPPRPRWRVLPALVAAALALSACAHAPALRPEDPAREAAAGGLSFAMERVRAIVASGATSVRDPGLEAWLLALDAEAAARTGRHVLPFRIGGPRLPTSASTTTYMGTDGSMEDGDRLSTGLRIGMIQRSLVLVDGDASIGFARDSIVIATGRLDVAHAWSSVIVSGAELSVSHAGSASGSDALPCVLATGESARVSFSHGAILVAPDGTDEGTDHGSLLLSSWGLEPARGPSVPFRTLAVDRRASPLEPVLEAAVGDGPAPRACLYRRGAARPLSCGTVGGALDGELSGWRYAFGTPEIVVLGHGDERIRLVPRRERLPPVDASIEAPAGVEVHVVGFYEPRVSHGRARVHVERRAPHGIVVVLGAYASTEWELDVAPGVELLGVVLGGYQLSTIVGVPPGVPVVTRMHALGETAVYPYEPSGAEHAVLVTELRGILGRPVSPASFTGSYLALDDVTIR